MQEKAQPTFPEAVDTKQPAIITKYHGPRGARCARILARTGGGSCARPYDYAMSLSENHARAVIQLCMFMTDTRKLNAPIWTRGVWRGASLPGGTTVWAEIGGDL